jgi:hypothetical protein
MLNLCVDSVSIVAVSSSDYIVSLVNTEFQTASKLLLAHKWVARGVARGASDAGWAQGAENGTGKAKIIC